MISWAMIHSMTAEQTTFPFLSMAIVFDLSVKCLIFHSDRGVQYACKDFRDQLGNEKDHSKYEQKWELLGQCCDGKLLQESQIRDYLW